MQHLLFHRLPCSTFYSYMQNPFILFNIGYTLKSKAVYVRQFHCAVQLLSLLVSFPGLDSPFKKVGQSSCFLFGHPPVAGSTLHCQVAASCAIGALPLSLLFTWNCGSSVVHKW